MSDKFGKGRLPSIKDKYEAAVEADELAKEKLRIQKENEEKEIQKVEAKKKNKMRKGSATSVGIGLGILIVCLVGVYLLTTSRVPQGATPGLDHPNFERFTQGLSQGGDSVTLTATSTPITAAQFCNNRTIKVTVANGGGLGNLQLPSSTAIMNTCLPAVEEKLETWFINNSSTGSFTLIATGGSSTLLRTSDELPTSTTQGTSSVSGATRNIAKLTSFRSTSGTDPWVYHVFEVYR